MGARIFPPERLRPGKSSLGTESLRSVPSPLRSMVINSLDGRGKEGLMGICPGVDLTLHGEWEPWGPQTAVLLTSLTSAGHLSSVNTAVSESEVETAQIITQVHCVLPKGILES